MKEKSSTTHISNFKQGLPLLKINLLRTLSFNALIDMSISHNLIDSNFIFFKVDEDFYTCIDENTDASPKPKMYLFKDFFKKLGTYEITGKDEVKQTVDKIEFNFKLQDKSYAEIFSVIEFNQSFYNTKDVNIDVVLGSDFIIKYKWIIDYNKQAILIPKKT